MTQTWRWRSTTLGWFHAHCSDLFMTSSVQNKPQNSTNCRKIFLWVKKSKEFYLPWHRNGDARSCCDIRSPSVQQTSFFFKEKKEQAVLGSNKVRSRFSVQFKHGPCLRSSGVSQQQTRSHFRRGKVEPCSFYVPSRRTEPGFRKTVRALLPSHAFPFDSSHRCLLSSSNSGSGGARAGRKSHDLSPVAERKIRPRTAKTDRWKPPLGWQKGERLGRGGGSRSRSSVSRRLRSGLRHRASPWSRKLRQELLRVQEFDSRLLSPPRRHGSQPCLSTAADAWLNATISNEIHQLL